MSENAENQEEKGGSKWMALLVLLVALLLLVGGVGGALMLSGNDEPTHSASSFSLGDPLKGRQVVLKYGCVMCHSDDGSRMQGPSFKGLLNSTVQYIDGSTGVVDEADVRYALREPAGKVIDTFEPSMPKFSDKITEEETLNLLAYLRSLGTAK
jgi:cytochrome c2